MTKKKMMIILISVISIFIFLLVGIAQTAQKKLYSGKTEYALIASGVYESVQSELQKPIFISLSMANDSF